MYIRIRLFTVLAAGFACWGGGGDWMQHREGIDYGNLFPQGIFPLGFPSAAVGYMHYTQLIQYLSCIS